VKGVPATGFTNGQARRPPPRLGGARG